MFGWMEEKIKTFKWYDLSMVKLSVFAFTLMLAKLWQPILSLDWWIYRIVFLVVTVYLAFKMFK